jgi:methionyl-tRNA formyltransferase
VNRVSDAPPVASIKPASSMKRLLIVTNGNLFATRILKILFEHRPTDVVGVITVTGDYYGRTGLEALKHIAGKTAVEYLLFKLFTIFSSRIRGMLFANSIATLERRLHDSRSALHCLTVVTISDAQVMKFVDEVQPDLLVSVSCPQKITGPLLRCAPMGAINIHSSLLPSYAGLAPYFWVLANGEEKTGTTVHRMIDKWDAGPILAQRHVSVERGISVFRLFGQLAREGGSALVEAVDLALSGVGGRPQDLSKRSYYSHPTRDACRSLRRRGHTLVRISDLFEKRLRLSPAQALTSQDDSHIHPGKEAVGLMSQTASSAGVLNSEEECGVAETPCVKPLLIKT